MRIKQVTKELISSALAPFGLEIRRRTLPTTSLRMPVISQTDQTSKSLIHSAGNSHQGRVTNHTLLEALEQAKSLGLAPATVIDVGAARGAFVLQCYNLFPEANYILIEPLKEFEPFLKQVVNSIPKAEYILAAATPKSGEITLNVHPDFVGSSVYLEQEDSEVNGVPRIVPAIALDDLIIKGKVRPPLLFIVDVQGAELDVLAGAEKVLEYAEYVCLEVSFFETFKDGPQFYDVIKYMKSKGFVVYDLYEPLYRLLDNALFQIDLAFVKERGFFRRHHQYATATQRKEQNQLFQQYVS